MCAYQVALVSQSMGDLDLILVGMEGIGARVDVKSEGQADRQASD